MDTTTALDHLRTAARLCRLDPHDVTLPRSRHIVCNGIRLRYLDWGGLPERRPILFLHGGALTAHTWDLVCIALRRTYRCLALDQRGHGDSEWSPTIDYGPDTQRRDLEDFIDALWLHSVIPVGQSMGAINALAYTAHHPRNVAALVLVDAGPDVRIEGASRIHDFITRTGEPNSIEALIEEAMAFNPRRHPDLLRRSLLHNLRQLPDGRWTWKYDRRFFERSTVTDLAAQVRELWMQVPQITCPTLVVRGTDSDVFTDDQAAELAARLPDGRWKRIEGAGHTVQGDNPVALADAIRSFLTEVGVSVGAP